MIIFYCLSGSLPTQIGNLNKLTGLHINQNSFSGKILYIFFDQNINWFYEIKYFSLSGSLPTQIGNLTALVELGYHTNSFSGIY